MGQTIILDDKEYEIKNLSDQGKVTLGLLLFASNRLQELNNMQALLQRAKNSYGDSMKKEMLSQKSGFIFGED